MRFTTRKFILDYCEAYNQTKYDISRFIAAPPNDIHRYVVMEWTL